jgi:hypothetical protein
MPKPNDPAYWEDFARGLGWDDAKVQAAGEIGSRAVATGMSPPAVMDVVLARVRDGKNVRVGLGPVARFLRNEGLPSLVCGGLAFLAAGIGRQGETVAHLFPLTFSGVLALQVFFFVRGLTRRGWKLAVLGLAMTAAALLVALVPFSPSA